MTTEITREQIKALRAEAREAGDMVQVALCEVAMGRDGSAQDICDEHPGVRTSLALLGVVIEHIGADVRAEELCAKAIAHARAQG